MKITCPFCKTEYNVPNAQSRAVCVVCGHAWTPPRPRKTNWLLLFAMICALLAALVFAVAVMLKSPARNDDPLIIESVTAEMGAPADDGTKTMIVSGIVRNKTPKIYGVPNMVVVLRDNDGNIVERDKILPPAPILDAAEAVHFADTVKITTTTAARATVEFE